MNEKVDLHSQNTSTMSSINPRNPQNKTSDEQQERTTEEKSEDFIIRILRQTFYCICAVLSVLIVASSQTKSWNIHVVIFFLFGINAIVGYFFFLSPIAKKGSLEKELNDQEEESRKKKK
ncbi:uncharacterized protein MONOS_17905 [Monocercomonoides exilis]|uniref:uncharacterized protein n=1 Tax=Monocercomonoides exilis TaxID=2049356 RepID=UPI00355A4218|nr:hypothetical protein MONOS_17905 [Monocercomonoides exilis]